MTRCFVQEKYRFSFVGVVSGVQNVFRVGNDRDVTTRKRSKSLCAQH
jgi:hypothetical protein